MKFKFFSRGGLVSVGILIVVTTILYLNMTKSTTKMMFAIEKQTNNMRYVKAKETVNTERFAANSEKHAISNYMTTESGKFKDRNKDTVESVPELVSATTYVATEKLPVQTSVTLRTEPHNKTAAVKLMVNASNSRKEATQQNIVTKDLIYNIGDSMKITVQQKLATEKAKRATVNKMNSFETATQQIVATEKLFDNTRDSIKTTQTEATKKPVVNQLSSFETTTQKNVATKTLTVRTINDFKKIRSHKNTLMNNANQTSTPKQKNNQSDSPTASSPECRCSQNGTCSLSDKQCQHTQKTFVITWYHIPFWTHAYPGITNVSIDSCEYSNCEITMDRENAQHSDAVIFDGRMLKPNDFFTRPTGQIWIFAADEAPRTFHMDGGLFSREPWISSFNWTMVYDRSNTDIHFPYGEIIRKPSASNKDYKAIYGRKNKTALIVHSNCHMTMSERVKYVSLLANHVTLDSLGDCGTRPFDCGERYVPDKCFEIINGYKFYLAFENALCDQYFTEKAFNNYNYDSILVVRGGRNNDSSLVLPAGTYIATNEFNSVKDLADYMNKVAGSETLYTEMLKRKNEYYSVPRKTLYQRALCTLCERMNKQDAYKKTIPDINEWAFGRKPCEKPSDLNEFN